MPLSSRLVASRLVSDFVAFTMAVLGALASPAASASTAALETIGTPLVGQSFDMLLRLDQPFAGLAADESLLSFGFHLGYDSSLLKFVSFSTAAGWDNDSAHLGANIFSASNFPGLADLGQGSVLLATLRFDVLASGNSAVNLFTDLGDYNQGLGYLYANPEPLSASTIVTAVPEPATYLLMAGGLITVVVRRRRAAQQARRR